MNDFVNDKFVFDDFESDYPIVVSDTTIFSFSKTYIFAKSITHVWFCVCHYAKKKFV